MTRGFEGKVATVTGGAGGIGLACAEAFAEAGAIVAIADVDAAGGEAAAARLGGSFRRCDVSSKADVDAFVAAIAAQHGGIDILVNNAGVNRPADFLALSEEDFDLVIATNLKSVFLFSQAVAKTMVAAGTRGAIVNMSSGNAVMTGPKLAAYAASKGGICTLTKVAALALAPHGIRVNAIGPGTILTEMTRGRLWDDRTVRDGILSRTPLGRFGEAAEVADLALFLASDAASYLTGQTIFLDGGRNALNYTVPVPADPSE